MRKIKLLFIFILCISFGRIHAQKYAEGVVLVRVKNPYTFELKRVTDSFNFDSQIAGFLKSIKTYRIEPLHLAEAIVNDTTGKLEREFVLYANSTTNLIIENLNKTGYFEWVQPNYIYHSFVVPDDDEYGNQWYLDKINMPQAWDIEKGCNHIRIAVLDAGFYPLKHKDVKNKYFPYRYDATDLSPTTLYDDDDVSTPDTDVSDGLAEHGLFVCSVAGAQTDNNKGMAGVGWDIDLVLVRVGYRVDNFSGDCSYETDDLIRGIDWVVSTTYARIINLSIGDYTYNQALESCVNYAYHAGCIFICSSGNISGNTPTEVAFPARMTNVIAVGASDQNDNTCSFECFGPELDLVAPGKDILVAFGKKEYTEKSGTSFSAPIVAGVVALLLSLNPQLSFTQIRDVLIRTTDRPAGMQNANFTDTYGYGRLDAYKALKAVKRIAPDVYVYNESPDRIQIVYAQNRIFSSNYTIHNDCKAEFRAGTSIHLQDGFHAGSGSYFHAYIDDVRQPCVSYKIQTENDSAIDDSSASDMVDIIKNVSLIKNPVNDIVQIQFAGFRDGELLTLTIINGSGASVMDQKRFFCKNEIFIHEVDVSRLTSSNYFLIICNNEKSWSLPFVKI